MKRTSLFAIAVLMVIAAPAAAQKQKPSGVKDFTFTIPLDIREFHPSIAWGAVYCETSTLDSPLLGPTPELDPYKKPDPKAVAGHVTDDETLGGTRIGSGRTAFPLAGQQLSKSGKDADVKGKSGKGSFEGEVTVAFDAEQGRNASAAKSFLCLLQFAPAPATPGRDVKAAGPVAGPPPTSGWMTIFDLSTVGGASFREEFRLKGPGGGNPLDPQYVSGKCGEPQAGSKPPGGPYPCAWHGKLPQPPPTS